jgi:hypothetical protein
MKRLGLLLVCIIAFSLINCETWAEFEIINQYHESITKLDRNLNGKSYFYNNLNILPGTSYNMTWWDDSRYRIYVITADNNPSNTLDFIIPKGNLYYKIILNEDGVLTKE